MTHAVDKPGMISGFLAEQLVKEVADLLVVIPVLDTRLCEVEHFHNLDISAAVTRTLQRTDSRRVCGVGVGAGGRYGTAGERRVVSAAVLSVEHKAEVEQVSFLGSVGTVVAQGGKNALCKALVLVYLVHYH